MRGRLLVVVLALLCVPVAARAAQGGGPPCPPGSSPNPSGLVCVFADKVRTDTSAKTTTAPEQDPWLRQALEAQHHLGDPLPFRDAMWVGTHNSFNTIANPTPSLSNLDSNQHVSLVQQLDLGVRGIEIDVHWMLNRVVVCHARPPSEGNAGCTTERVLADELKPVADWLDANRRDVVLLYLEDNIGDPAGYAAAAAAANGVLGDRVYTPAIHGGGPCPTLPLALSRQTVLTAGKQAVIMSGCDASGAAGAGTWNATVFDDSIRSEEGNPDFGANGPCTSPSVKVKDYGTKLVRFYEDSTFVSAAAAGGDPGHRMTTDEITAMVACGVNLFGLDQIDPVDPRVNAMVWSWAEGEPASGATDGQCAIDGHDSRFHAVACDGTKRAFACVDPATGDWFVTAKAARFDAGDKTCAHERPGAVFAVPGSGNHAARLRAAKSAAGVDEVWLAYATSRGSWRGVGR